MRTRLLAAGLLIACRSPAQRRTIPAMRLL
jgi:hypothetical protein